MSEQNIFSCIKSNVSIIDVINQYTTLKRAGVYWKGQCPFHNEKTASFTVSPHIDIFYCFGCQESGDVIAFIAKVENCTQLEAAHHLANRYNIDIPRNDLAIKKNKKKITYELVCNAFAEWCYEALKKNPEIIRYLKERGFSGSSIDLFKIGYLPSGLLSIKQLCNDLQKKHILSTDLIEAQLIAEGKTVLYSPFEDRILFSIKDHLGNYCGFGGRTWRPQDTRPKYYNSRENDHFSKGTLLFGLDMAKKAIQESGHAYLVEGYTDCIAMVQHGYHNTVATLGTACTPAHLKLLSRYASGLKVMYDNDSAGHQAILRLTQLCWQVNLEPQVITVPKGQDPASLLARGDDITPYLANAEDIFVFFIKSVGDNFISMPMNQKLQVTKTLLETIALVEIPFKQDILLQKMAEQLDMRIDIIKTEFERVKQEIYLHHNEQKEVGPTASALPVVTTETPVPHDSLKIEKKIFCALFNNIQLLNKKEVLLVISYLPSTLRALLLQLKEKCIDTENTIDFPAFFESLNQEDKNYVSTLLFDYDQIIDETTFDALILQLKKKWWKSITQSIKEQIGQAKRQGNEVKVNQLLADFVQLQHKAVLHTTDMDEN